MGVPQVGEYISHFTQRGQIIYTTNFKMEATYICSKAYLTVINTFVSFLRFHFVSFYKFRVTLLYFENTQVKHMPFVSTAPIKIHGIRSQPIGHSHDVIKSKNFPRYWPFVRGIHRSPVNSPHRGQWGGALIFSFIYVWINGWVNTGETGDLRRHPAHYDITVMVKLQSSVIWMRPNLSWYCIWHWDDSGRKWIRFYK